mmetsp:Transcript_13548/g.17841  ORF Transcript_13548/g.17841 Transcript_13548/m.17841 type:complete len:871 (+) Transcript_13548:77-2689(+)
MVDYGSFSNEQFDVTKWVNDVLNVDLQNRAENESQPDKQGPPRLDSHISAISTKLQILAQDIGDDLERSMIEIMGAVPRSMLELERLENTATSLHAGLDQLKTMGEIAEGEGTEKPGGGTDVVAILGELDRVKRNMEACQATLVEAASWHQLVRQVQAKFASGDLVSMADELEGLQRSMVVLQHLPEAEERANTLVQLQEQLEVLLKPQLLQALQGERPPPSVLAPYVQMYHKLGRQDALEEEYTKARPAYLHKAWFAYPGSGKEELLQWFSQQFLEQVYDLIVDEKKRCSSLFSPSVALEAVCKVLLQTFQPIQSSITGRARETLPWPGIVQMYTSTLGFMSKTFQQLEGVSAHNFMSLAMAITSPFHDFQNRFQEYEEGYLQTELQPLKSSVGSVLDSVKDLKSASEIIGAVEIHLEALLKLVDGAFDASEDAVKHCMSISSGFQALALVKVIGSVLCSHLHKLCDDVKELKGILCSDKSEDSDTSQTDGFSHSLFSSSFDWQYLQGALRCLTLAGHARSRLGASEAKLGKQLREAYPLLFTESAVSSSMTPNEIGAMVGRLKLNEDQGKKAELRSLLTGTAESFLPGELLAAPSRDCLSLASESLLLMFDTCFKVIRSGFSQIKTLKTWSEESEELVDIYSILPQDYMTQSGEHLLQLLQQLEPFAFSDALVEAAVILDGQHLRLGAGTWGALGVNLKLTDSESAALRQVVEGTGLESLLAIDIMDNSKDGQKDDPEEGGQEEEEEEEDNEAAHKFCNDWLSILGQATTGAFLSEITTVEKLTERGSIHAAADTAYLMNIFNALDLPIHPMLQHLHKLLKLPLQELSQESLKKSSSDDLGPHVAEIVSKFNKCIIDFRQPLKEFEAA